MTITPIIATHTLHINVDTIAHKPKRFDQFFTNTSSYIQQKQLRFIKAIVWVASRIVDLIHAIALKILWGLNSFGIYKETTLIQSASTYKETAKIQSEIALLKNMSLEDLQNLHPTEFTLDVQRQQTVVDGIEMENSKDIGQKIFELLRPKTSLSDHDLHILRYLIENLLSQGSFMVVPGFFEEFFTIHHPLVSADLASWTEASGKEPAGQTLLKEAQKPSSLYELKMADGKLIVLGLRYFRIFEIGNPNCIKGFDACKFEIAIKTSVITASDFLLTPGAVTCKMQSYGFRPSLEAILW